MFGNRRTGLPSLRKVAREMCRLIYAFTPVIRKLYGDNVALMAALESANVACDALVEAIDESLPAGT
jgi:hypothetical protein